MFLFFFQQINKRSMLLLGPAFEVIASEVLYLLVFSHNDKFHGYGVKQNTAE
jgi:hypothetical protein